MHQDNLRLHIKKSLERQKLHHYAKNVIKGHLKQIKAKLVKLRVKKHHDKIHHYHKAEKKTEAVYRRLMKSYDSHLKKFKNARNALSTKLSKLNRNRLPAPQVKKLNLFVSKIMKRLKK
jgi:hypothetical protein